MSRISNRKYKYFNEDGNYDPRGTDLQGVQLYVLSGATESGYVPLNMNTLREGNCPYSVYRKQPPEAYQSDSSSEHEHNNNLEVYLTVRILEPYRANECVYFGMEPYGQDDDPYMKKFISTLYQAGVGRDQSDPEGYDEYSEQSAIISWHGECTEESDEPSLWEKLKGSALAQIMLVTLAGYGLSLGAVGASYGINSILNASGKVVDIPAAINHFVREFMQSNMLPKGETATVVGALPGYFSAVTGALFAIPRGIYGVVKTAKDCARRDGLVINAGGDETLVIESSSMGLGE